MALLEVRNLTFAYPLAPEKTLRDVSFSIEEGEFRTVIGATGSGKTTLLRLLKKEIAPLGEKSGETLLAGRPMGEMPELEGAAQIAFVAQHPEQQLVTDKVWHEMAFGLENLAVPPEEINRRMAEMAAFFGMEAWFDRRVAELSGGQKQLLCLASALVMRPKVLILDEPTAQLDPIAASEFIATVRRINRELGLTVLMTEHRLEEVLPLSDRVLILDEGRVIGDETPREVIRCIRENDRLLCAMPAAARLFHAVRATGECPLDAREGRQFVMKRCGNGVRSLPEETTASLTPPALTFRDVFFRYERNAPDVLRGLTFTVRTGEICCILGGNGAGKTTALHVAAGLERAYSGQVEIFGQRIGKYKGQSLYQQCLTLLPQDVQTVFLESTVEKELSACAEGMALLPFDFAPLMRRHPYDLSGGEQQMVALSRVLSTRPRLLLLDEPTKGIDAMSKRELARVLRSLKAGGMTLVMVTHDVEFAAQCADRCALFFRGEVVSSGTPRAFFSGNSFYTTAVSRMTRGHYDGLITVEEAAALIDRNGGPT